MNQINPSRWLILTFLIIMVGNNVSGQMTIDTVFACTCDDEGERIRDSIVVSSDIAGPVWLTSYSGFFLPDSVLYHEADVLDDEFFLSTDEPERDTLTPVPGMSGTFYFVSYRNPTVQFDAVNFSNGATMATATLPVCTFTDDAIGSITGDTVLCLNQDAVFAFDSLTMVEISSAVWTVTDLNNPMTGSGTTFNQFSGSGVPMAGELGGIRVEWLAPGSYNIEVNGLTSSNCPINSMVDVTVLDTDFSIVGFDFTCIGDTMPLSISEGFDIAIFDSIRWSLSNPSAGSFVGDSINVSSTSIAWDSMATTVEVYLDVFSSLPSMCSFSDTLTVTLADTLNASIMGDTIVCLDEIRTFRPNVLNAATLAWTSTSGTILTDTSSLDSIDILFSVAGLDTIIVTGMSTMGCTIIDTFVMDVKDSQISLSGGQRGCLGDTDSYIAMYSDSTIANFVDINWEVRPMNPLNDTMFNTIVGPNDNLLVTWGAVGRYQIAVNGMTDLGCELRDSFTVLVQDTAFVILGEQLACVTDMSEFRVVQASDSSNFINNNSLTWNVIRDIDSVDVGEFTPDMDSNAFFNHTFTTGTFTDETFYLVTVSGTSVNGCTVSDTIMVEVIGNRDLAIDGPMMLCAGANAEFALGISDSLLTGPLNWSVTQKSNGAPLVPAALDDSQIDTLQVSFPNVEDTFIVQAMGMIEGQCDFTVMTEVILTDTISFVDIEGIDTTCLSQDSQWYVLTIDTGQIDVTSLLWDVRRLSDGTVFFPVVSNSGSSLGAYTTWTEAGEYVMRVQGSGGDSGCDIDELLNITVKDTAYIIDGDKQICIGDTFEYVLLQGWNNMPIPDFPPGDSVNWVISDSSAFSYSETIGDIGDTIRIAWSVPGKYGLTIMDSTLCCPINVLDSVLVRDANEFIIVGDTEVCAGDVRGYVILNPDGTFLDDLIPDSSMWTVANGTLVNDGTDSVTVRFDLGSDFTIAMDTISFTGMTNDGCPIDTTIIVQVQNLEAFIAGPTEVCFGDSVMLNLLNSFDSTSILGIDTVQWIIMPGDTLIDDDSLGTFIDSFGVSQMTWTEVGTYNISARAYIGDSCVINASTTINVNEMPEPGILGDLNTCINSTDVYTIAATMDMLDNITWTVTAFSGTPVNGAMIVGSPNEVEVEIAWTEPGEYFIEVMGTTTGGCDFMYTQDVTIVDAANIGQLVCNNEINVTLGESCELMLTPDVILGQPDLSIPFEQYEITVSDAASGIELSSGLVDPSLLGVRLKIEIVHECSGQSCWGYVTLEDKDIPQLLCGADTVACDADLIPRLLDFGPDRRFGYPVPDTITQINQTSANPPTFTVSGFEKCGDATLTYNDRITTEICDGDFGTLIFRDWTMTNVSGLSATCTDTIRILRVNIDSIDLSVLPDTTVDCTVMESDLQPGPITGELNLATDQFCFNIQADWTDDRTELCGNGASYRIIRTWTIFDWCSGEVIKHIQIIDVVDTQGPTITLNDDPIEIEADDHSCTGLFDLTPDIVITDNCSGIDTVTVRIFENDSLGKLLFTITDQDYSDIAFDPDVTQIFIDVVAVDSCDRQSEESVIRPVNIVDNIMPVPVCDENTTVSIGESGWAIAAWTAFDDSSYDNCGIESICVTRMDEFDAFNILDEDGDGLVEFALFQEVVNCQDSYESSTEFIGSDTIPYLRVDSLCRPYVKFCCLDAMDTSAYLVRMTVTDLSGNTNICMINTFIQDNSPVEVLINAGDDTISCQEDIAPFLVDDGSTVSFLSGTCGVPLAPDSFNARVDTNSCGIGTITRTWVITDDFNNTEVHIQAIAIGLPGETFDPGSLDSIWPQDFEGEGCNGPGSAPEMLDSIFRPNIDLSAFPCSSLALDHEDLVFNNVEGYCTKIIRTWTLIDWCVREDNPNEGTYTYAQILKLNDTEAPVINFGCQEETFEATNQSNCSASVQTTATATDCKASEDLNWNFVIKDADGLTVQAGNTFEINTILSIGTYEVTWTAEDDCGNMDECTKIINVIDGRAPAIECRSVTLALDADGMITATAQQFIVNADDNCSAAEDLIYTFQSAGGDLSQMYECDDLNGQASRDFTLQVFVTDEAGNESSCNVTLTITDDNAACTPVVSNAQVAGVIFNESDFTIDEVEVRLTEMTSGEEDMRMTPIEGAYAFSTVTTQKSYEISASREDAYMNGVTTLDILLIQRHLLGLRDLGSPYKLIAADVDGSGRVSVVDLVHIRKLILGVDEDLPIGQPWTFVDASQTWANENNPFPYNQVLEISSLDVDEMNMDFVGVKMADVNGNAELASTILGITRSVEALEVNELERNGQFVTLGLTPKVRNDIAGFQLGLTYDTDEVQILSVNSKIIDIADEQYTIHDGEFRISWNTNQAIDIEADLELLELTLAINDVQDISEVFSIENSHVAPEIYHDTNNDVEVSDLYLDIKNVDQVVSEELLVEQNMPNPFQGSTTIRFYIPQRSTIKTSVYDLTGQSLYDVQNEYDKGWNSMTLTADDIGGAGAYIYEITDGNQVIRKKMISVQ